MSIRRSRSPHPFNIHILHPSDLTPHPSSPTNPCFSFPPFPLASAMTPSSEDDLIRDLYSIPRSSSWFQWDEIHERERRELPEFFDGSAASRNLRVYKEYRDFIINKFREDPFRRLTFAEVRKSLIGDVGTLHKVFLCLERWGLINFGVSGGRPRPPEEVGPRVVVEEPGAGVQVVPASSKLASGRSAVAATAAGAGETGFRLPPLSSYSDMFGDWAPGRGPVCAVCGDQCVSGRHEPLMEVTLFKQIFLFRSNSNVEEERNPFQEMLEF